MTPDVPAESLDAESLHEDFAPPLSRMLLVVVALLGIFVAGYLTLHRFGYIGTLQCSVVGGCETVQASAYAFFPPRTMVPWGMSVALIGLIGYAVLFVIGLIGLQPGHVRSRWVARSLLGLSGAAFVFSIWLTYIEAEVLEAWCQWCVVSAILIGIIFLLSLPGLRAAR
ncbi:MAG TPA: vitamin K epoxide reductase family protein [Longimicrobiaceae bacterium]